MNKNMPLIMSLYLFMGLVVLAFNNARAMQVHGIQNKNQEISFIKAESPEENDLFWRHITALYNDIRIVLYSKSKSDKKEPAKIIYSSPIDQFSWEDLSWELPDLTENTDRSFSVGFLLGTEKLSFKKIGQKEMNTQTISLTRFKLMTNTNPVELSINEMKHPNLIKLVISIDFDLF